MATECIIQANPDISGIGIRIAVYVQAFLALIPGSLTLINIHISPTTNLYNFADPSELSLLSETAFGLLITGMALLISAIVQAKTFGLTVYHALIVLNLSWLNNTTALASLLTYWMFKPTGGTDARSLRAHLDLARTKEFIAYIAHFSASGAIGVWLFSNISHFDVKGECTPSTTFWIFGHDVLVTNSRFSKFWLGVYSISMVPILNYSILVMLIFAFIFPAILASFCLIGCCLCLVMCGDCEDSCQSIVSKTLGGMWVFGSLALDISLILTTEMTIAHNRVGPEDSQWTFGQTLALMVVLFPALGLWNYLHSAWKRRAQRHTLEAEGKDGPVEESKIPDDGNGTQVIDTHAREFHFIDGSLGTDHLHPAAEQLQETSKPDDTIQSLIVEPDALSSSVVNTPPEIDDGAGPNENLSVRPGPSSKGTGVAGGDNPSGRWEERYTRDGRKYYVDHQMETTSWSEPSLSQVGWEKRKLPDGRTYFVDHNTKSTSWDDPRLSPQRGRDE